MRRWFGGNGRHRNGGCPRCASLSQRGITSPAPSPTDRAGNGRKTTRGDSAAPPSRGKPFAPHGTTSMSSTSPASDVFSVREIARAAGVSPAAVRRLIDSGELVTLDGRFVAPAAAIAAVQRLRRPSSKGARELFSPPAAAQRSPGRALAASTALHGALLGAIVLSTTLGVASAPRELAEARDQIRMVFLPQPGPGGGGGGGGLRQPDPPARAAMKGPSPVRSPVPPPRIPPPKRSTPDA